MTVYSDFYTRPEEAFGAGCAGDKYWRNEDGSVVGTPDNNGNHDTWGAFAEQIQNVIATAGHLHACKVGGDFSAFEEACRTAGLVGPIGTKKEEAAKFYWERMTGDKTFTSLMSVKTNGELACALGILLKNDDTAKNRLLYHLFEAHVGNLFRVDIVDGPYVGGKAGRSLNQRRVQMFHVQGERSDPWGIKLCTLFQGKTPADILDQRVAEKSGPLCEALGPDIGLKLGSLLYRLHMILPDAMVSPLLGEILKRGLAGEEVILTGAFCPDYAYEKTGNPNLPYRYTFEGVGNGVGLVARQFARVIPPLSKFLGEMGVKHRVILGIGDFEADSAETLARVKLTYDEFVAQCQGSLKAFKAMIGEETPVTLELCDADRCKGRLRPYAGEATSRMLQGDFGRMGEVSGDPETVVQRIIRDNGDFYRRWYSPDMSDTEIRRIVLTQGGEYAALSRIYAEDLGKNVIVISGDRPEMHKFDDFFDVVPTLCVKRAY